MTFYIRITEEHKVLSIGEIKIGNMLETFDMAMGYWTASEYKSQWIDGLKRVALGKDSALITSLTDPTSANYIVWWTLYARGSEVLVHNQLLILDHLTQAFKVDHPYAHVPSYSNRNEDGEEISEWVTTVAEIGVFLDSE
jgi:hypothetical protein